MESAAPEAFREALCRFASGVIVAAAETPSGPVGFTASAFTSVSLDPPLILICVGKSASALGGIVAAPFFGVSVLAQRQAWIASQFARSGIDRFAGVSLDRSSRAPLIEGALAQLECARHAVHEAGDHVILLGRVVHAAVNEGRPLLHFARCYGAFFFDAPAKRGGAAPDTVEQTRLDDHR